MVLRLHWLHGMMIAESSEERDSDRQSDCSPRHPLHRINSSPVVNDVFNNVVERPKPPKVYASVAEMKKAKVSLITHFDSRAFLLAFEVKYIEFE